MTPENEEKTEDWEKPPTGGAGKNNTIFVFWAFPLYEHRETCNISIVFYNSHNNALLWVPLFYYPHFKNEETETAFKMAGNLEIIVHKSSHFISEVKGLTSKGHMTCPEQSWLEEKELTLEGDCTPNFPLTMTNQPPSGISSYLLSTFSQYYINCLHVQILTQCHQCYLAALGSSPISLSASFV